MIGYTILKRIPSAIQPIIIFINPKRFKCQLMTLWGLIKWQPSSILYSLECILCRRNWLIFVIKSPVEIVQWNKSLTTSSLNHLNTSRMISQNCLGVLDRFYKYLDFPVLDVLFIWYLLYCYLPINQSLLKLRILIYNICLPIFYCSYLIFWQMMIDYIAFYRLFSRKTIN